MILIFFRLSEEYQMKRHRRKTRAIRGVNYTICNINFIFSKDSRLSLTSNDICDYFGTSNSTTAQKSRTIKDLLKISQVFDPNFSLKEIATNNPFNRLRMLNGFIFFD